jgi:hypothetical protein
MYFLSALFRDKHYADTTCLKIIQVDLALVKLMLHRRQRPILATTPFSLSIDW